MNWGKGKMEAKKGKRAGGNQEKGGDDGEKVAGCCRLRTMGFLQVLD